ncbi:MAG: type II secretion system protein [Sedimentisphaerales bacterium]|nr:type II secretion system protein [Sedimentisphaerales bacterium]
MNKKKHAAPAGFTLVELMITIVFMIIIAAGIGTVILDNQRGWSNMYGRINSDVVTEGYAVRKQFDSIVRNASSEKIIVSDTGEWIEFYGYYNDESIETDIYKRLYHSDDKLYLEYGQLSPRATISVETICSNVSDCTFKQFGRSAQMILKLDDGKQTNMIVTSAVTNNQ